MKCKKCGHEIEDGHKICLNCGSAVDFIPALDEEEQEKQIEQLVKRKPIQKISRQMLGGVLVFIIACLFVGICMAYASKTLSLYSSDDISVAETTASAASATEWEPLQTEPITAVPYTGGFKSEYRRFPLRMTGCYVEVKSGSIPKLYVTLENTTEDYIINDFTIRVVAYNKDGERISKNNSDTGSYIDFKFKSEKIQPGERSPKLELVPAGFEKGVTFCAAVITAQSSDGYKYTASGSSLIWKRTTVSDEKN